MFKLFQSSPKSSKEAIAKAVNSLVPLDINASERQRLIDFLDSPDERYLYHANPRFIAEQLQLTERETLNLLIKALKQGIMTLNWDIQCPVCEGIDFAATKLQQLHRWHVCPACQYKHESDADQQVRVTFSIDERLRSLSKSADDATFRQKVDHTYGVVSAHRLLTLQTFRDLFPRETIPPNESLLIRQVTILFTDLAGSTALYSQKGDSQAYSLVRQHFDLLFEIVDRHNGAVVKTIGDAIMAAFTSSNDALKAAIAMQAKMQNFNQNFNQDSNQNPSSNAIAPVDQLILKVGIHTGACISVTLNERADYFGTTVNTAARVQGLSQGNDIVFTEALRNQTHAIAAIENYISEQTSVLLKGLSEPVTIFRMAVNSNLHKN